MKRLTAGKQSFDALKNRWLGRVAARVALERLAGGFEAFEGSEGGQMAVLNALKNRWLEHVAARVALERHAGRFEAFEGFEGGQTAVLNALKNRWLERVAARVALERHAGRFEGFEGLRGLKAGKQSFSALKDSWLGRVAARVATSGGPRPQAPPLPWPRQGSTDFGMFIINLFICHVSSIFVSVWGSWMKTVSWSLIF